MELNENAQVDTSQVDDRRGSGGGGGGDAACRSRSAAGAVASSASSSPCWWPWSAAGSALNPLGGGGGAQPGDNTSLKQSAPTHGRLQQLDCRNILYVNSIQAYWRTAMPQVFGKQYQPAKTEFFSQNVNTGCGQADSGVGPFYCPADELVYIDLTFYDDAGNQFGARASSPSRTCWPTSTATTSRTCSAPRRNAPARRDPEPNSRSVRLELQADCYAGVWANHATETKDANGQPIFKTITTRTSRTR